MDIAFVNRMLGLTRGGGEIWHLRMAEALKDQGVEVTFYIGKPLFSGLADEVTGFDVVEVPTPTLKDTAYAAPRGIGGALEEIDAWRFRQGTVKRLRGRGHDIVHVNSDPRFARLLRGVDASSAVTMHGLPHSFLYDTLHPYCDSYDLLKQFDSIIGTGVTAERIEERTNKTVTTINPGVDTEQFTPGADDTSRDDPTVLFVGRFVPVKNILLLIDAFANLQIPDAKLVLVGDGPVRSEIESRVAKHGLSESIEMPGYVDHEKLPAYYQRADVFALSSKFDNHPITILEALSCGTPVVAPRVGWIPNMVEEGETGLLYDEGDETALATHLQTILRGDERRTDMGEQGRATVVNEHDWREQAKKLLAVFESVLDEENYSR